MELHSVLTTHGCGHRSQIAVILFGVIASYTLFLQLRLSSDVRFPPTPSETTALLLGRTHQYLVHHTCIGHDPHVGIRLCMISVYMM